MNELIRIDKLKEHPQNTYFFDDITGGKWDELLESIKTSGVYERIIITPDRTIVSGHQRVRACKDLGIEEIKYEMRDFDSNDDVLKCLIETNTKQRGTVADSDLKQGRRYLELERIYGIKNGGDRKSDCDSHNLKTQNELAAEHGVSQWTWNNKKNLTKLIPELQQLMLDKKLSTKVALIYSAMPHEEQLELYNAFGEEKVSDMTYDQTKKEVELLKDKAKQLEIEKTQLKTKTENLEIEKQQLQLELQREKNKQPEIKVVEKVVDNTDYTVQAKAEKLEQQVLSKDREYKRLHGEYSQKVKEIQEMKQQIESLKQSKEEKKYVEELEQNSLLFCAKVEKFIKEVGGLAYLSNHLNELSKPNQQAYLKCVELINAWGQNVLANTHNYL